MYLPKAFQQSDPDVQHALLRDYPFACVVLQGTDGLAANHLPLELVNGTHLHGHVARGNELARADGAKVLVIFQAADAYVSPHWYPSKQATGREVPTWNYAVAHVHGRLRVIEDSAWLRRLLERLTDRHEATQPSPWRVDDAPPDYIERMLGAIVGIEIAIERIDARFKLSQNHLAANRAGVMADLAARGGRRDAELEALMRHAEERRHDA